MLAAMSGSEALPEYLVQNALQNLFQNLLQIAPVWSLFVLIAVSIAVLVKGADLVVEEAVGLAARHNVSKVLIGATIVSIGTTLPEAAVSVMAAATGMPDVAVGNAAGSVICNFGLILGVSILLAPTGIDPTTVRRHGRVQLATALLLPATVLLFRTPDGGGRIPQTAGLMYVVLLSGYLALSVYWARHGSRLPVAVAEPASDLSGARRAAPDVLQERDGRGWKTAAELLLGIVLVVGGSRLLVPAVQELALRLRVPDAIVAATLVAFGTSVPELATAVTAARKGHGELAVGNVIGANVLNVLLVIGVSASVTPGGLYASRHAAQLLLPAVALISLVVWLGVALQRGRTGRLFGALLLVLYSGSAVAGYLL